MIDFSRDKTFKPVQARNQGDAEGLSKAAYFFLRKGDALFISSRFEESKEAYGKSLEAYQKGGDQQGAGLCLTRLGRALEILGRYEEARRAYRQSLEIFKSLGDNQGMARSKAHLGNVDWATGDYQEAAVLLEEAFSFYRAGGDVAGQAWVHDLMGNLGLAMRKDEEAESHYLSAYSLAKKQGDNLQLEAWNHYHLGAVALFRGQKEEAQERFEKALSYFVKLKDDLGQVAALVHLGEIACLGKDLAGAQQRLLEAVRKILPTQCKPLLADALTAVAQLLKSQGEERKAIGLLMVALSHPTCRQQTKDRMVDLVLHLQSNFIRPEVEEGFKWAKTVGLEEMASGWMSASAPKDGSKSAKKKRK
jgi:hypothetical protein